MYGKDILKNNCLILFDCLKKSVKDYLEYGHTRGEVKYIDAFLSATIHSLIDYADSHLDPDKKNDEFNACRYANNVLKHNPSLITLKKTTGGLTFPIEFPFEIPKIQVVWDYNTALTVNSKNQQHAFEILFAEKPILDTLVPLVEQIKNS